METRSAARWAAPKSRFRPGKSAEISCSGPFFDPRPAIPHPTANALFVSLAGLPLGTLTTPPHLPEHLPHVPHVQRHAKLATNHLGDAFEGPHIGLVAGRWGAGQQNRLESTQLLGRPSRFPSRTPRPSERVLSTFPPGRLPATGRLPAHSEPPRDLGLRTPPTEQLPGLHSPALLGPVIAAAPPLSEVPSHVA